MSLGEPRRRKKRRCTSRFAKRIEEGLESLARRIEKSKRSLDRGVLERQIGRLLERNSRAAGRYAISISEDNTVAAARVKLSGARAPNGTSGPSVSEGTYILRSNIHDWSDEELWKTYIQLSEAEAAFRIQKSDLCIRPIWHHKASAHQGAHPRCASWPTRCGRRCSNGNHAPASVMPRARF